VLVCRDMARCSSTARWGVLAVTLAITTFSFAPDLAVAQSGECCSRAPAAGHQVQAPSVLQHAAAAYATQQLAGAGAQLTASCRSTSLVVSLPEESCLSGAGPLRMAAAAADRGLAAEPGAGCTQLSVLRAN
jgi:hypothetical protein